MWTNMSRLYNTPLYRALVDISNMPCLNLENNKIFEILVKVTFRGHKIEAFSDVFDIF